MLVPSANPPTLSRVAVTPVLQSAAAYMHGLDLSTVSWVSTDSPVQDPCRGRGRLGDPQDLLQLAGMYAL